MKTIFKRKFQIFRTSSNSGRHAYVHGDCTEEVQWAYSSIPKRNSGMPKRSNQHIEKGIGSSIIYHMEIITALHHFIEHILRYQHAMVDWQNHLINYVSNCGYRLGQITGDVLINFWNMKRVRKKHQSFSSFPMRPWHRHGKKKAGNQRLVTRTDHKIPHMFARSIIHRNTKEQNSSVGTSVQLQVSSHLYEWTDQFWVQRIWRKGKWQSM